MYEKVKSRLKGLVASAEGSRVNSSDPSAGHEFEPHRHIRLLSFNIQVGISTSSYHHYLTRSWQHFLPHQKRFDNLDRIGGLLQQYDVVALQEVDGGSLRSGFVNQVQYLAEAAGFPYWYQQLNRNLGKFAQHSNGLLSRYRPLDVESYRLPGIIPGRGVIVARYGDARDPLVLVMMHLSLGRSSQVRQLSFVRELIQGWRHVVLMGDMNTHAEQLLEKTPLKGLDLVPLPGVAHTFPSWRPGKALDHMLVSPSLTVRRAGVVPYPVSDHLPIALDVALPQGYLEGFGCVPKV